MANPTNPPSVKWSMSLKVEWGLSKFSRTKWYSNNISNKLKKYHQLQQQMKNNKNELHNPCEGTSCYKALMIYLHIYFGIVIKRFCGNLTPNP
jgi:hypothetical protein